jgi:hypothetical protein
MRMQQLVRQWRVRHSATLMLCLQPDLLHHKQLQVRFCARRPFSVHERTILERTCSALSDACLTSHCETTSS